jgi:hypothetical protein
MVSQVFAALVLCVASVLAQPFAPGSPGVLPLGNLRTNDGAGPYNLSLVPNQVLAVKAGIAAKKDYTDQDIINFLTNVECLEGQFDTWGAFGVGFNQDLSKGGPIPVGARGANLTERSRPYLQEVALNEQGHALAARHLGSILPCPPIDFINGFNTYMLLAFNLTAQPGESANDTVARVYGAPFDPFLNDQNFVLSVLSLEELGAKGNLGLTGLISNPVIANAVGGFATSANAQAASERRVLWDLRNEIIQPFGETAQQVFARISVVRDTLDGPQVDDQGLVNTDPRNIAVPDGYVNIIPTDVLGLTYSYTPQQVLRIVTFAAPGAKGGFFPQGVGGRINDWVGYDQIASGLADFPTGRVASAAPTDAVGNPPGPITPSNSSANVTDILALTQAVGGPLDNGTIYTRGYTNAPPQQPFTGSTNVAVANNAQTYSSAAATTVIPTSYITGAMAPSGAFMSPGSASAGRRLLEE